MGRYKPSLTIVPLWGDTAERKLIEGKDYSLVVDANGVMSFDLSEGVVINPHEAVRFGIEFVRSSCDCHGCAPSFAKNANQRQASPDFRAFAGLNTSDRKTLGAAQFVGAEGWG